MLSSSAAYLPTTTSNSSSATSRRRACVQAGQPTSSKAKPRSMSSPKTTTRPCCSWTTSRNRRWRGNEVLLRFEVDQTFSLTAWSPPLPCDLLFSCNRFCSLSIFSKKWISTCVSSRPPTPIA